MSNYRRLISYIYAYEGGVKGKNIGFAKLESRGTQCKIGVNVKNVYVGSKEIGVFLLTGDMEVYLGNIFIRGGAGEFRAVVSCSDVEHSGFGIDQCYGLTVHELGDTWQCYTTIWEDAVAHAAEVDLEEVTSENRIAREMENTAPGTEVVLPEHQTRSVVQEIEREVAMQEETADAPERGSAGEESEGGGNWADTVLEQRELSGQERMARARERGEKTADGAGESSPGEIPSEEISPEAISPEAALAERSASKNAPEAEGSINKNTPSSEPESGQTAGYGSASGENAAVRPQAPWNQLRRRGTALFSGVNSEQAKRPPQPENPQAPYDAGNVWNGRGAGQNPAVSDSLAEGRAESAVPVLEIDARGGNNPIPEEIPARTGTADGNMTDSAETPKGNNPPSAGMGPAENEEESSHEQVWGQLKREHVKIQAFDYEKGCEILSIKPQDIGLMPRENWIYGNNSFLLHGYYNYRYLVLAKLNNPDGKPRYLLGIPGHYYSNEKYMASMFGFPNFVLSKSQPERNGRFGYWYTDISLGS